MKKRALSLLFVISIIFSAILTVPAYAETKDSLSNTPPIAMRHDNKTTKYGKVLTFPSTTKPQGYTLSASQFWSSNDDIRATSGGKISCKSATTDFPCSGFVYYERVYNKTLTLTPTKTKLSNGKYRYTVKFPCEKNESYSLTVNGAYYRSGTLYYKGGNLSFSYDGSSNTPTFKVKLERHYKDRVFCTFKAAATITPSKTSVSVRKGAKTSVTVKLNSTFSNNWTANVYDGTGYIKVVKSGTNTLNITGLKKGKAKVYLTSEGACTKVITVTII